MIEAHFAFDTGIVYDAFDPSVAQPYEKATTRRQRLDALTASNVQFNINKYIFFFYNLKCMKFV